MQGDELWHEQAPAPSSAIDAPTRAKVAADVASVSDPMFLTVDSFDGGLHRFGPCAWTPRVDAAGAPIYPHRGDLALMVEDEEENAWVLVWWPYDL